MDMKRNTKDMTLVVMALLTHSTSNSLSVLSLSLSSFSFFVPEHLDNVALIDQFFLSHDHEITNMKILFLCSPLRVQSARVN